MGLPKKRGHRIVKETCNCCNGRQIVWDTYEGQTIGHACTCCNGQGYTEHYEKK